MTIRPAGLLLLVSLMLPTVISTVGCGASRSERGGITNFSDKRSDADSAKTGTEEQPEAAPAQSFADLKESPELTTPTDIPLEHFEVPDTIGQRLNETHPETVPKTSTQFAIFNQFIKVEPETGRLTFTGMLRISGKQDERLELSCVVDKTKDWSCTNMFPTDPKVASEGRLQATARCIDECRDKMAGVKLFILIDGKIEQSTYYSYKFKVWTATSGDFDEEAPPVQEKPVEQKPPEPVAEQPPPKQTFDNGQPNLPPPLVVEEKPTPAPQPVVTEEQKPPGKFGPPAGAEELNEETFKKVADDPNSAVETSPTFNIPDPTPEKSSPKGIETQLTPKIGSGVRQQSIGTVTGGKLKLGVAMPKNGAGFKTRNFKGESYGPDIMIEMIKGAAATMESKVPKQPGVVVCDIAGPNGGDIGHASHRNGLDADISFPSTKEESSSWAACDRNGGTWCPQGAKIADKLDEARLWIFLKSLVCAKGDPVRVMFIEPEIKRHMCKWVKNNTSDDITKKSACGFKTLRAMKTSAPGHNNHVHVRLKCPGNDLCVDQTWDLSKDGTGC